MMPKLSETLPPATELYRCQQCGGVVELARWMECDDADQPSHVLIVLCQSCSDKILQPHPRLYQQLHRWRPWTGAMAICVACQLRDGLRCKHPSARQNGGAGLKLTFPQPGIAFIDESDPKTGKHRGRQEIYWAGPVTDCAGRVV